MTYSINDILVAEILLKLALNTNKPTHLTSEFTDENRIYIQLYVLCGKI
jgi:hypothetical protein